MTNPDDEFPATDELVWLPSKEAGRPVEDWQGFLEDDEEEESLATYRMPRADVRARLREWLNEELAAGTPFLFAPVLFGLGAIIYFLAPREPFGWAVALLAVTALAAFTVPSLRVRWPVIALALVVGGFAFGKARTAWLDTPVVAFPTVGHLTGTVTWTERRAGGSVRYVVRVEAFDGRGSRVPRTVRVVQRKPRFVLSPGARLRARVRLIPPSGPVVPGGYDFAFYDWFAGRGANGTVLGEIEALGAAPADFEITVSRARYAVVERLTAGMDAKTGPLARALVVGDRSGIDERVAEDLRLSGLAHILAISGLHMMLVTGMVFLGLRKVCALLSTDSLRWPVKKWAALGALCFATAYLLLSGMNVSTQRAYVMVVIMLSAVLLDRQAVTLRNVAIAALAVLAWQPEAIFHPGFQMSFAATAALVACYAALTRWNARRPAERSEGSTVQTVAKWVGGLSFTSLVAGFATAPFAAYHFHRIALLSLVGNLLAMPLVTFFVMPLTLAAVIAMPLGLDNLVLPLLAVSLENVARIAEVVASYEVVGRVGLMGMLTFSLYVCGLSLLILLRTPLRLAGVPLCLIAAILPARSDAIAVVSENGRSVVAIETERLVLSSGSSDSFANKLVSEAFPRDGEPAKFRCDRLGCAYAHETGAVIAVSKKPRSLRDDCRLADLVVSRTSAQCPSGSRARVLDSRSLKRSGSALVVRQADGSLGFEHAYGAFPRPWTRHRFD